MESAPHIHFLHIGKTGGTSIKAALAPFQHLVQLHGHGTRLCDVPVGDRVFFFLRDPVSRFVSAFNSRLRCGRPRYNFPWSREEARAFASFKTPDELGLALSSANPLKRHRGHAAMKAIQHLRSSYWDWLESEQALKQRAADIVFIGQQEHLAADFAVVCERLEISQAALPQDEVVMHQTPARFAKTLSDKAAETLKAWYAADYEALRICREIATQRKFGGSLDA
jgi:hypothetical protein